MNVIRPLFRLRRMKRTCWPAWFWARSRWMDRPSPPISAHRCRSKPCPRRSTGPASILAAMPGSAAADPSRRCSIPATTAGGNDFGGIIGGVQGGYNIQLLSGLLLGVEADISFPSYIESNSIVSSLATARSDVTHQWDFVGTTRGRSAMPQDRGSATPPAVLPGPASAISTPYLRRQEKALNVRLGWAAGAGLEYAFAPHWSARLEYLYYQFDSTQVQFPSATQYASGQWIFNRSALASTASSTDLPASPICR